MLRVAVLLSVFCALVSSRLAPPKLLEELEQELGEVEGSGEGLVNVVVSNELIDSPATRLDNDTVLEGSGEKEPEFVKAIDNTVAKINNNPPEVKVQECSPGPCCPLDTSGVPPLAWRLPRLEDPQSVLAVPTGSETYPDQTSMIVNLTNCFPLAVRHSSGCAEIAYGGMHLIRCVQGSFRHVFFPKTKIIGIACGHC